MDLAGTHHRYRWISHLSVVIATGIVMWVACLPIGFRLVGSGPVTQLDLNLALTSIVLLWAALGLMSASLNAVIGTRFARDPAHIEAQSE